MGNNSKIAFVERTINGESTESQEIIAEGLRSLGYEVCFFSSDQLPYLKITRKTPVRANISTFHKILEMLSVPIPKNIDIPDSIKYLAGRKVWKTTLGILRKSGKQVFIKALEIQKAFKGHVMYDIMHPYCSRCFSYWCDCIKNHKKSFKENGSTISLPDNFKILAQEVVEFGGEYRFYVCGKKVYNSRFQKNDTSIKKYVDFAKDFARRWKDSPVAYSFDIGNMTIPGKIASKIALVEVNQMYSCGLFGINTSPKQFAAMHVARWNEIVGL